MRSEIQEKADKKYYLSEKSMLKRKAYKQSEKGKAANRKYHHSKKGKLAAKKHSQSEKGKLARRKADKKYLQSEKGKRTDAKNKAKRKRSLGWILIFPNPFIDSVLVDYHHITDAYVVAIPRDLHLLYYGKNHREKIMEIVKQIYLED